MSSSRQILDSAMQDLEEIFVLNSRNTITDSASASQVNGTVLRARQLSNSLTSNADDAVTLDRYITEILPQNAGAPSISEDTDSPEPMGSIIVYHNGQTERGCGLTVQADNNGSVKSGYVPDIKITDILGDIAQKGAKINDSVKNPSISKPSLGLIQVNSPFLTLPTRNVLPVSLFCSSIPTIEMSRAVPFVIARVISPRSPLSEDGNAKTLSLISMARPHLQRGHRRSRHHHVHARFKASLWRPCSRGLHARRAVNFRHGGLHISADARQRGH